MAASFSTSSLLTFANAAWASAMLAVGSACSCLAGEDSGGSGEARVASAGRNKPPILVGMSEKVVNNSYVPTHTGSAYHLTRHCGEVVKRSE